MKVFRAIAGKELELYKENELLMEKTKRRFALGWNTFFSEVRGKKTFYLTEKDAKKYAHHRNENRSNKIDYKIAEYDIPIELLAPNIGCGLYNIDYYNHYLAYEFAIPFEKLVLKVNEYEENPEFLKGKSKYVLGSSKTSDANLEVEVSSYEEPTKIENYIILTQYDNLGISGIKGNLTFAEIFNRVFGIPSVEDYLRKLNGQPTRFLEKKKKLESLQRKLKSGIKAFNISDINNQLTNPNEITIYRKKVEGRFNLETVEAELSDIDDLIEKGFLDEGCYKECFLKYKNNLTKLYQDGKNFIGSILQIEKREIEFQKSNEYKIYKELGFNPDSLYKNLEKYRWFEKKEYTIKKMENLFEILEKSKGLLKFFENEEVLKSLEDYSSMKFDLEYKNLMFLLRNKDQVKLVLSGIFSNKEFEVSDKLKSFLFQDEESILSKLKLENQNNPNLIPELLDFCLNFKYRSAHYSDASGYEKDFLNLECLFDRFNNNKIFKLEADYLDYLNQDYVVNLNNVISYLVDLAENNKIKNINTYLKQLAKCYGNTDLRKFELSIKEDKVLGHINEFGDKNRYFKFKRMPNANISSSGYKRRLIEEEFIWFEEELGILYKIPLDSWQSMEFYFKDHFNQTNQKNYNYTHVEEFIDSYWKYRNTERQNMLQKLRVLFKNQKLEDGYDWDGNHREIKRFYETSSKNKQKVFSYIRKKYGSSSEKEKDLFEKITPEKQIKINMGINSSDLNKNREQIITIQDNLDKLISFSKEEEIEKEEQRQRDEKIRKTFKMQYDEPITLQLSLFPSNNQ